jgi:hypothetical protein
MTYHYSPRIRTIFNLLISGISQVWSVISTAVSAMTLKFVWTVSAFTLATVFQFAHAQSILPAAVPFDWIATVAQKTGVEQSFILAVYGWVLGYAVQGITALYKRVGGTTGIQTVIVSAVLSAVMTGVLGYFYGAFGHGWDGVLKAVVAAAVSMAASNGVYHSRVQTKAAGAVLAHNTIVANTPVMTPAVLTPAPFIPAGPEKV